jgi:hypothetical protein
MRARMGAMKLGILSVALLVASAPLCARSAVLSPVTQFTVRGGTTLDTGPLGILGFVQEPPQDVEDETFFEFDLSGLSHVSNVKMQMDVYHTISSPNVAHTFEVSLYTGSGMPSLSRFHTGTLITTLSLEAAIGNVSRPKTFQLDVTSLVQSRLASGSSNLGFRLHDPTNAAPTDTVPFVKYRANSALLLVDIPEPKWSLTWTALIGFVLMRKRAPRGCRIS